MFRFGTDIKNVPEFVTEFMIRPMMKISTFKKHVIQKPLIKFCKNNNIIFFSKNLSHIKIIINDIVEIDSSDKLSDFVSNETNVIRVNFDFNQFSRP